ncbi:MAG: hypothetical protein WDW20_05570 [Neisseriaceae bacterium]
MKIQFKASLIHTLLITGLHLVTFGAVVAFYEGGTAMLLLFLIGLSYAYALVNYQRNYVDKIEIKPNSEVHLFLSKVGPPQCVQLEQVLFKSNYWMVLKWRSPAGLKTQTVFRDMCSSQEYHQLFLWVNWLVPQTIRDKEH